MERKKPQMDITGPDLRNSKQFQMMYQRGRKAQGQLIQMTAGRLETRIPVPGMARILLGWAFVMDYQGAAALVPGPSTQVTISLNNDILVNNGALFLFIPQLGVVFGNQKDREYFQYERPLTGNDTLIVTTNNPVADTFRVIFQFHFIEKTIKL